ncbi:MAG: hypothetical protein IKD27_05200 [Oscillospiraceae bacterium]|nr:hypothetical protein [Oscillospiraceae bacterium]
MARKFNDRYVRFYTAGSAAAKVEPVERRASLPEYQKTESKRKPIPFDPFAFAGSAMAIFLAVLMLVGLFQVAAVTAEIHELETQLMTLEMEEAVLAERYESGYDLDEVRIAAESMGMIPMEEATHIQVDVPTQTAQTVQLSWWDTVLLSLRDIFA